MILNILPDEFFEPGDRFVVPALGVEVEHGLVREAVGYWLLAIGVLICSLFFVDPSVDGQVLLRKRCFDGVDEVEGGVEAEIEEMGIGEGVFFGGFVADVVAMSIPAAAGVGKVEDLVEIEVEVGFGEDAVVGVVGLGYC